MAGTTHPTSHHATPIPTTRKPNPKIFGCEDDDIEIKSHIKVDANVRKEVGKIVGVVVVILGDLASESTIRGSGGKKNTADADRRVIRSCTIAVEFERACDESSK